jgi:hypothetical protein
MKKILNFVVILFILNNYSFASGAKFDEIGVKFGENIVNFFKISGFEDRICNNYLIVC